MKKYSSGSFIDAAVRVYGSEADTLTSFPASIIANGGNITPWTVYGNTVEGVSVGEKTINVINPTDMLDGYFINTSGEITVSPKRTTTPIFEISGENMVLTYNTSLDSVNAIYALFLHGEMIYRSSGVVTGTLIDISQADSIGVTFYSSNSEVYVKAADIQVQLAYGSTILPFEPYGYKLPVVIGSNTTKIYMADVLRKSTGADPVYDIMSSTGVITRNVDTDGTPLVTPTTESFTAPTLATVAGSQSVNFDTTVKPSKAELTYTGWHTHSDKKRSGGAWT